MNQQIKNIIIVGGGTAGWMAAAAFSKILSKNLYNITLVESEQIGTVGVGEATLPLINLFNKNVLQIDENEFVRETNATFKLGIEFVNWRKIGHSYFHPFGRIGVDMDGIGFLHYWLRWYKAGGGLDFSNFNAETEAARVAKFTRTANELAPKVMPDIYYAFHFDASLYAAYLRRYSEKHGVKRIEGIVETVNQHAGNGYISSLVLKNGEKVEGDFFIDCSGFKGLLIEQVYQAGYHDWSHWLPVNRAAAVPCESAGELLPYTKSTAREAGWQWRIPLQHRTGNGYVFCDKYISEDEAANKLLSRLDGRALAEPKILRFVTGVRKKSWIKNCVTLGLSNGFLEPLESTSIHLVQVGISKILTMFPRNEFNERMINRYNSEMYLEYEGVKDFLIAHYKVTEREDTDFWRYVKNMSIPDSLEGKLESFKLRGEVMPVISELFKEDSWFAVLAGQGLMPDGYHPVADTISAEELKLRLMKIRTAVQGRIASMPKHSDFIRQHCESKISKIK